MIYRARRNNACESNMMNSLVQYVHNHSIIREIENMGIPKPKHILVVDDDPVIREILIVFLNVMGFEVESFDNGADALEAFKVNNFKMVLTDIQMPIVDGWELISGIKKMSPETPVILITGMEKHIVEEGMKHGRANSVLFKPFKLGDLKKMVDSFLTS